MTLLTLYYGHVNVI